MGDQKKRVLIIGCTPPPYHGQAMMISNLATGEFEDLKLYLLRMSFSGAIDEVGKVSPQKVFHLFEIIGRSFYIRLRHGIKTFYYSPGGSTTTPIFRDIILLFFLRLFFRKAIFHFHSAGTASLVEKLITPFKYMARRVYRNPDLAIYLSSNNLDNEYLDIHNYQVIPNGLRDDASIHLPFCRTPDRKVSLLYVGILKESKGVMVLLEAIKLLKERLIDVECKFVGAYDSEEFRQQVISFCEVHDLYSITEFVGPKQGPDKWTFFENADIFCFPSFYQSESFGNVLVEAMMFELPVIATQWRGIPDIVEHGVTGLLIQPRNPKSLADAIQELSGSHNTRINMGLAGRSAYLKKFSRDIFLRKMELALKSVATH